MLALNVPRQYLKCHVLIVRGLDSKYARHRQVSTTRACSEDLCTLQHLEHSPRAPAPSPTQAASSTSKPSAPTCAPYCVTAQWQTKWSSAPPNSPPMLPSTALSLARGTFTVSIRINPGDHAQIEVEDDGGPWTPLESDPTGHRGLDIVRALASAWGVQNHHTTRAAWARFDWPS
jgi:hypothetical protein